MIIDAVMDSFIDSVKLLPFLFLTYLAMEYLEHRAGQKMQETIRSAGAGGPAIGSVLGVFPQCGFSAAASGLYAARMITLGTLLAVFLSTSDEMLPVLISEQAPVRIMVSILLAKAAIGIAAGIVIDLIFSTHKEEGHHIHEICEQEHCHCEEGGIFRSAFVHTVQITCFLLLITFLLNLLFFRVGEETLAGLVLNRKIRGPVLAGIVGLIPNCAGSVAITKFYLEGVIGTGAMLSGLLTGSGVGLLILFRVNHNRKENLKILGLLYLIGVLAGVVIGLFV